MAGFFMLAFSRCHGIMVVGYSTKSNNTRTHSYFSSPTTFSLRSVSWAYTKNVTG